MDKKNDGSDDWLDITEDEQKIVSKLQWKLCRKKSSSLNEETENARIGDHDNKRKPCISKDTEESRAPKKMSSNESVAVLSLSRVIGELQRDIDMKNTKIRQLEAEIACLKASKNTDIIDDSGPVYLSDESSNNDSPIGCDHTVSKLNDSDQNGSNGHTNRNQTTTSNSGHIADHDPFHLNIG